MPKLAYDRKNLSPAKLEVIHHANRLLASFAEQGFTVTLRQLYYQFVALDLFSDDRWYRRIENTNKWEHVPAGTPGATKNNEPNYNWLGDVLGDGRMCGYIDWDLMEDRMRNLSDLAHWETPGDIVDAVARQFRTAKWKTQPEYVEVWIEKDALVGVIEPTCQRLDVPFFCCRGYTSMSEMWSAGQRLMERIEDNKHVTIIHLGDHDPSGVDMTRDIEDRLTVFLGTDHLRYADEPPEGLDARELSEWAVDWVGERFRIDRIALNMDQIRQYDPPPNPAKVTDSRAKRYIAEHGRESWELDALTPSVLAALVEEAVLELRDEEAWAVAVEKEEAHRKTLAAASRRWDDVAAFLKNGGLS